MIVIVSEHQTPDKRLPWLPFGLEVLCGNHDYWFHLAETTKNGKDVILAKCSVFVALDDSHASLENVFVPLAHRGHGYAQCLLRHILSVLPCNEICVKVSASNTAGNRTFEKVFGPPVQTEEGKVLYCFKRPPPFNEADCL